ncbi:MAG: hypothetical protein JRH20_15225 [Deltaproteobacteria bacterium]|nr:hypothetical protein [Deltaproteobacteria bacterium]
MKNEKVVCVLVFSFATIMGCTETASAPTSADSAAMDVRHIEDVSGLIDANPDAHQTPDIHPDVMQTDTTFRTNPTLATLNDNQARDLGTYACPSIVAGEPSNLCQHITDYSGFVYNAHSHRMMMFGGGHSSTSTDDVVIFDFDLLTWTSSYTPTPCAAMTLANYDVATATWTSTGHPVSRHTYDKLVIHPANDRLVVVGGRAMGAPCVAFQAESEHEAGYDAISFYNPLTKTWRNTGFKRPWHGYAATEIDPQTGQLIIFDTLKVWSFDLDTLEVVHSKSHGIAGLGIDHSLVYYPPTDTFYSIRGDHGYAVYEIKLDRSDFSQSSVKQLPAPTGDAPPIPDDQFYVYYGGYAYDSHNEVIGGGVRDGSFYIFFPRENRWEKEVVDIVNPSSPVGDVAFHALDYDPINNVFIFINRDYQAGPKTFAYRYRR